MSVFHTKTDFEINLRNENSKKTVKST